MIWIMCWPHSWCCGFVHQCCIICRYNLYINFLQEVLQTFLDVYWYVFAHPQHLVAVTQTQRVALSVLPMTVDPKASEGSGWMVLDTWSLKWKLKKGWKLLNTHGWMIHGDISPKYSLYCSQDVAVGNQNTSERHRCAFYLAMCQLEIVSPSPSCVFCGCLWYCSVCAQRILHRSETRRHNFQWMNHDYC